MYRPYGHGFRAILQKMIILLEKSGKDYSFCEANFINLHPDFRYGSLLRRFYFFKNDEQNTGYISTMHGAFNSLIGLYLV